jgi:transposase
VIVEERLARLTAGDLVVAGLLDQKGVGLIKAGNPQLRTVLMELAHRLKRWDQCWAKLAFTMRMRDKKGSIIAAAVANRWVRWLFHQMQSINQAV